MILAAHLVALSLVNALPAVTAPKVAAREPAGASGVAATSKSPGVTPDDPQVTAFASIDKGAGIERKDGLFSVAFHLVAQPRIDWNELEPTDQVGFRFTMVRTQLRGNLISKKLKYFFQAELWGQPSLVDMEFYYEANHWANLHFGQFVTPFSRQFLVPPFRLLFPDFAPSNLFFRDGRQRGVMVEGQSAGGFFSYAASFTTVNGIGVTTLANEKDHPLAVGRVAITPWGANGYSETPTIDGVPPGLTFGINSSIARQDLPVSAATPTTTGLSSVLSLGADAELHLRRFSLAGEAYARRSHRLDHASNPNWAFGGYLQVGVMLVPKKLELGLRQDLLALSSINNRGRSRRSEAVLAYYFAGSHLKTQLRYAFTDAEAGSTIAPAGTSHGLTLQTQIFF